MFSIEQSGFSIKGATIDELLIEYIKKYACMCHNGSNGSNITGSNQEQIKELITSTVGEQLEKYALAKDLESYALQTQLFDYVKTEDFNTEMLKYASSEDVDGAIGELRDYIAKNCALSTEIPEVPENIVTSDSLSTALEPYAKLANLGEYVKTQDLPEIPTDLVNGSALTTALEPYALTTDMTHAIDQVKGDIPEIIEGQTTIQFTIVNNTIPDLDYDTYHELIEQYGLDIVSSNNFYTGHYVHVDYSYNDDQPSQIMRMEGSGSSLWFLYDCHELINPGTGETPEILSCSITKNIEPTDKNAFSSRYVSNTFALKTDIPEIPTDLVNESALATALEPYAKLANLSEYAKTKDLPDMVQYETKTTAEGKYALKADISKEYFTDSSGEVYIKDPNNILTLGGANQTCSDAPLMVMKPNHSRNARILSIGNQLDSSKERWLDFDINVKSDEATIKYNEITALKITQSKVYIMNAYDMDGNAYAKINSNTTITHYCPIEESMNSINDFVIGAPVYMTGKVYRYDKSTKSFISSTESDTTDCICSVKTNGKWNTFIGICTSIDEANKCVTFASGGDYLVKVKDTSCYAIGDEVFVDDDNVLKIITGATAITSKIRRTTVGIITGIINENMLAVFKA